MHVCIVRSIVFLDAHGSVRMYLCEAITNSRHLRCYLHYKVRWNVKMFRTNACTYV